MTAEEKWDKLRAHYVAIRRHMITLRDKFPRESSAYDDGYIAALNDVLALVHNLDQEES